MTPHPGARKTVAGVGSITLPTRVPSDGRKTGDPKQDIESNISRRLKQGSDPNESGYTRQDTNPGIGSGHTSNDDHNSNSNQTGNSKRGSPMQSKH